MMDEQQPDMEHTTLVEVDEFGVICIDCGAPLPRDTWAAPRLLGVSPEGTDISELICLSCLLRGALFAVLSIKRDDPEG